jgi:hypothetical protein
MDSEASFRACLIPVNRFISILGRQKLSVIVTFRKETFSTIGPGDSPFPLAVPPPDPDSGPLMDTIIKHPNIAISVRVLMINSGLAIVFYIIYSG